MIISVTLNPAVDQTAWVDRLEPGRVHRVRETHIDPAGKGINASRMAHRLGWPTIAFGFVGGETGNIVRKALEGEGVPLHFVPVAGQTRINVTIVDGAGASSFFGPGPEVAPEALASLDGLLRFWLPAGRVLVLAGSVPRGVPADTYAQWVRAAHDRGVKVFLDADDEALRLGIEAGPDLIKPNVEEAERLLGRPLGDDDAAVAAAARELSARGIETVVISMGRRGAICARGRTAWRIHPPEVPRRSTVGSGDAMVAGIAVALARGDDIEHALALGTAAGAATAMSAGTALGTPEDVGTLLPRVRIETVPGV